MHNPAQPFDPDLVYSRHVDEKPVELEKPAHAYDVAALCLRLTSLTHEVEDLVSKTLGMKREIGFILQRLDRLESKRNG